MIADVLTKPLARVKFEYFREKLGVLQIKIPPKRSDESVMSHNISVPSMVRYKCCAFLTW